MMQLVPFLASSFMDSTIPSVPNERKVDIQAIGKNGEPSTRMARDEWSIATAPGRDVWTRTSWIYRTTVRAGWPAHWRRRLTLTVVLDAPLAANLERRELKSTGSPTFVPVVGTAAFVTKA